VPPAQDSPLERNDSSPEDDLFIEACPAEVLERLRILVDEIPGFLAMTDSRGRYLLVNRKYLETFGKTAEEFAGHHYREVLPEDIWRRHEPWVLRCLAGETVPFEDSISLSGRSPMHVRGIYRPVFDTGGRFRFLTVVSWDVSEQVEAERALQRNEERLSVTLGSIGDGVVSTDNEGSIVTINDVAAELVGWPSSEAIGQLLETVLRVDGLQSGTGPMGEGPAGCRSGLLRRRNGGTLPVEERVSPIRGADGTVLGNVVVIHDNSASLRREEQRVLSHKLESLALLAGGIAHDFNNLLTGIQGNLSMALERADLPREIRSLLEDAIAASECSQGLTRQLLTFARGGEPVRRVSEIGPILRRVALLERRNSSVALPVELPPGLWCMDGDPGQIGQVVQNLVKNGIEASFAGSEVRIQACNVRLEEGNEAGLPAGPYLCVDVLDRGTGIPDEIRARVFDPYFSTKSRHSGLGLAIAHSIIARHGGAILVDSAVGTGSRFRVLLPAVPGTTETARGEEAGAAALPGGRALVMDDDAGVQRVCQRSLSKLGFDVVVASDGREAIERYRQALSLGSRFDVVLLDLTVPGGMGGVQTMVVLRELDPEVRAIVTSGYSEDPVLARFRQYGFSAVLPKPFSLDDLRKALWSIRSRPTGPD